MKRQHYVIPVLMLLTGVAWGDGYRSYNGSVPYGTYGNPYNPNTPHFYGYQGHYPEPSYNPYNSGTATPPYGRYGNQYAPGNPYTPYSSPNPYKFNGNPYAADAIGTPYNDSPYQARNPYRTYGRPYRPNHQPNPYGAYENPYHQSPAIYPYATDAQQLYHSHGYYQGTPSTPNSVPPLYEPPYGNRYSSDAFIGPYGNGNTYDSGNNQSNPFEQ